MIEPGIIPGKNNKEFKSLCLHDENKERWRMIVSF